MATTTTKQTGINPRDAYTPKPSSNQKDNRDASGNQVLYPVDQASGQQIIGGKLDPSTLPGPIQQQTQAIQAGTEQLKPTDQAPQSMIDQVSGLQGQVNNLASQKGLTLQKNAQGQYSAVPNLSQQYNQAHQALNQSGINPLTGGQGSAAVQTALQGGGVQQEAPSMWNNIYDIAPEVDKDFMNYDDLMSPTKQRQSLVQEYESMSKNLGLEAINAELISDKAIIEGTEDDIRAEITGAGGLATDSQVQAMGNARNKQLIKNYNTLLDTKNSLTTQLSTMMSLSIQDRNFAEAEFDRKLNFAFKIQEFKERATTNARNTYMTLGDKMGFDTLFSSMSPYEQSIAQKTMGITPQQAQQLALRSQQDRMVAMAKEQAQTKLIEAQTNSANRANRPTSSDNVPTVKSINGVDKQWNPATGKWENIDDVGGGGGLRMAQAEQDISLVTGLINDKNIRTAVGPTGLARFIGAGLDRATGGRQNFISGVEQLRSQLSLDSLIQAKAEGATFGALSEGELKVLSASASKLGTWAKVKDGNVVAYSASEKDFKKELEKINNFAKLDYILKGGDPASVGVTIMPNGVPAVRNSDGTYTELQ